MTKNCDNCMWGDKCSTIEDCDYYDPLEDDNSETGDRTDRKLWQDYLHYLKQEGN